MKFTEDTRVKIPCILHLIKLGYQYLSLKNSRWDEYTMPPYDLSNVLVVGISSRALFDLETENELFDTQGLETYSTYQIERINDFPKPGTGFRLVKNILSLNQEGKDRKVEVIVLSRNNPATSLRKEAFP